MRGPVRISAAGDIGLHGSIGEGIIKHGPGYPFELVGENLSSADVLIGNLEIPFAGSGSKPVREDISPSFR